MIDYTKQSVPEAALLSPLAPFAVVLDCVGGKDVVEHIDDLILHDPREPHLGIYVTIVGDSEYGLQCGRWHRSDWSASDPTETGRDEMGGAITNVRLTQSRFRQQSAPATAITRPMPYMMLIASTSTPLRLCAHSEAACKTPCPGGLPSSRGSLGLGTGASTCLRLGRSSTLSPSSSKAWTR